MLESGLNPGGWTSGSRSTGILEVRGQEQAGSQKALGVLPHGPCFSGRADRGHSRVLSASLHHERVQNIFQ